MQTENKLDNQLFGITMETKAVILILLLVAIIIYGAIRGGHIPKRYRSRKCMGKKWKSEFPNVKKEEIRKFLLLFTDAFAFNAEQKLKFEPQDKIIEIYSALYPLKGADSLELETLADDIEKEYLVNFNQVWSENLTLGELFNYVMNAKQGAQAGPAKA